MNPSLKKLFLFILLPAFLALAWTTFAVLKLEREERIAVGLVHQEREIRRALTEMNAFLASFMARENARPLFHKTPGSTPLPSSLDNRPPFVRSYFMLTPDGRLLPFGQPDAALKPENSAPSSPVTKPPAGLRLNAPSHPAIRETPFLPHWQGNDLVYLKQIPTGQGAYTYAIWVDWVNLRSQLLDRIYPILPNAALEPLTGEPPTGTYPLVSLPAVLQPGEIPHSPAPPLSTLQIALLLVWCLTLLGAGSLITLLIGTARLSERRAAFVSAVTHELRTPLTNFSLYTEMLDEGLVPEAKKANYLSLLRAESTRLIHLVENVLAYARIEKRKNDHHLESLSADRLFDELATRTELTLKQGGVSFRYSREQLQEGKRLCADRTALEQILDNLTDNALKYAVSDHPEASLILSEQGGRLTADFIDNGPGIGESVRGDLFSPFTRSAEAAAGHKPGVGLGLALARDAARMMKGELVLKKTGATGTTFRLTLPLSGNTHGHASGSTPS